MKKNSELLQSTSHLQEENTVGNQKSGNEQLVTFHDIPKSPIRIIEANGKFFATLMNYRLTEEFNNIEDVHEEMKSGNFLTTLITTIVTDLQKNPIKL